MLLLDKNTTLTAPTSYFLTRVEFEKLYPYLLTGRKNYLFKYDKPLNVPDGEGKLLLKKYSHLLKWEPDLGIVKTDRHRELKEKYNYYALKKMGTALGMSFKEITIKTEVLIDRIVIKELEKKGDEGTK